MKRLSKVINASSRGQVSVLPVVVEFYSTWLAKE
jgi:hypothetical protein